MEVTQLDLPIQDVERLRKVLNKHVPFKNVWAYGSRVKGTASKHSDLDMVVFGASEAQLYETRDALEESNVPVEVQLFRWEDLPTNFHENIQQAYYVVQRETDWCEMTLGDVVRFGNGKTRPKTDGEYPIYGGNGILGYSDQFNYDGKTVVIGRVGAYCGATYYEESPIWVSDNALAVKSSDSNDIKYIYYLLKNLNLRGCGKRLCFC